MAQSSLLACLIDGRPGDLIEVADRGLAYGDGVFETIAIVDHTPALWGPHLDRLIAGCTRLGFSAPSLATLAGDLAMLTLPKTGVLKIIVTRGSGGRGYAPPKSAVPRRVMQVFAARHRPPEWRQKGVKVRWCQTRLAAQPALAGVKHLNRLEQVLARQEWEDEDIAEGLMCDAEGALVEATAGNLIIEKNGEWILPIGKDCGVEGVMQNYLVRVGEAWGIPITRRQFLPDEITDDTAMFICNSLIGIWPVISVDQRALTISSRVNTLLARLVNDRIVT